MIGSHVLYTETEVQATWLGHAALLVQMEGVNFLTDPALSLRASPISWAGPRRVVPPALALKDLAHPHLPHIDFVVISHNHYDHLDTASVTALYARFGDSLTWCAMITGDCHQVCGHQPQCLCH